MRAGGGDLDREPSLRLPDHVGEVSDRFQLVGTAAAIRASRAPSRVSHPEGDAGCAPRAPRCRRPGWPRPGCATGTTTAGHPCRLAASTAGSTPRTGRTRPSSANSPSSTVFSKRYQSAFRSPTTPRRRSRTNEAPSIATVLNMQVAVYARISKDREGAGLGVDRHSLRTAANWPTSLAGPWTRCS